MALTKDKKNEVISEVSNLLDTSRLTVVATYDGTPVKAMQQLRRQSRDSGTVVKVIKNRMFIKALQSKDKFKDAETASLTGMLLYAFNSEDEVAPAQNIAQFAKDQPTLKFVGGFTPDGSFMSAEDVTALANLPSKDALRAQLVGTISAPISGLVNVVAGNLRSLVTVLNARAESISN